MKTNYVLIDYENVQVKSLALFNNEKLRGENFRVTVFLGPKNPKISVDLAMAMQELGNKAEYIKLDASGHNALDFHITYYLGKLAATDASAKFCIISKDTGFDSLIEYIKEKNIDCSRAVSIEAMLGVKEKPLEKIPVTKTAKPVVKQKAEELVARVVANLIKRVAAKPRTEKTLRSTIKTLCGLQYGEKELDAVFNRLIKKGYVVIEGTKLSYKLPE